MRIAVSLKTPTVKDLLMTMSVSIRRADRCLAEVSGAATVSDRAVVFQSAVRIAVSLKMHGGRLCIGCSKFQSAVRIAVSLKNDIKTYGNGKSSVSIRRADRCLAEEVFAFCELQGGIEFQSAVRIAVSLKCAICPRYP